MISITGKEMSLNPARKRKDETYHQRVSRETKARKGKISSLNNDQEVAAFRLNRCQTTSAKDQFRHTNGNIGRQELKSLTIEAAQESLRQADQAAKQSES